MTENELRGAIANTVNRLRKDKSITLKEMAERTKLSLGYLSCIELARNSPSLETLLKICHAHGITLVQFFKTVETEYQDNKDRIEKEIFEDAT